MRSLRVFVSIPAAVGLPSAGRFTLPLSGFTPEHSGLVKRPTTAKITNKKNRTQNNACLPTCPFRRRELRRTAWRGGRQAGNIAEKQKT